MTIVAVAATKGGAGKTTTAVSLAFEAAAEGHHVRLFDLDPQGSAVTWAPELTDALRPKSSAEVVMAARQWEVVFLDLPPGAQPATLAGLEAADVVVAVCGLGSGELDGLVHLTHMVAPDLIVPTRWDRRRTLHAEALTLLRSRFGERLCQAVPMSAAVERAQAASEPVPDLNPAAIAYRQTWRRLQQLMRTGAVA